MQPSEEIHCLVDSLAANSILQFREAVPRTFAETRLLAEDNEWGVALELLCENLYEYGVPLNSQQYETIRRLAISWGLPDAPFEYLSELIIGEGTA